jgi:hypothetical protein
MALDATVGGASANSYVTVSEANAFFSNRLDEAQWTAITDPDAALMMGTANLDLYDPVGNRASETQALKFPRYNVPKPDRYGYYLPTEIPQPIKNATFLFALAANSAASSSFVGSGSSQKIKIGNAITYESSSSSSSGSASATATAGPMAEATAMLIGIMLGSGTPVMRS